MRKQTQEKQFEDWIVKKVAEYKQILCLTNWKTYVRKQKPEDTIPESVTFRTRFAGEGYLENTIIWTETIFKDFKIKDFEFIETCLLHEMIHVIIFPYDMIADRRYASRDEMTNANETLCDHLSRAIHQILKKKSAKIKPCRKKKPRSKRS